jgi:hypothetical protein
LAQLKSGAQSPTTDYITHNIQRIKNGRVSSLTTNGKHEKLVPKNERSGSQLEAYEEKMML